MSLRKKNLTYECIECGNHTDTLHEIFYGTAGRKVCIDYALQVPLCTFHHNIAHNDKITYKARYNNALTGENVDEIQQMVDNPKDHKEELERLKDENIRKIKQWEY
jgi:predicted nucleic acid-binding Zn ribbon protein